MNDAFYIILVVIITVFMIFVCYWMNTSSSKPALNSDDTNNMSDAELQYLYQFCSEMRNKRLSEMRNKRLSEMRNKRLSEERIKQKENNGQVLKASNSKSIKF